MSGNNEIDWVLLGALGGSAWHDNNPGANGDEQSLARGLFMHCLFPTVGTSTHKDLFYSALYNTMRGRCYNCGDETDTRWSVGVYCCPACAVTKPGVTIKGA